MGTYCFHLDPYFTLDVDKKASNEEITKAYRQIVRNRHPDGTKEDRIYYGHVKEAFQLLIDVSRRQAYDKCRKEELRNFVKQKKEGNIRLNPSVFDPVVVALALVAVTTILICLFVYFNRKLNEAEESRRRTRVGRIEQRPTSEEQRRRMQRMQLQQFLDIIRAIEQRIQVERLSPASNEEIFQRIVPFQYGMENETDERELCTICQDLFEDGQNACHLPRCQHTFHVDCIYPWLRTNAVCPNCKTPLNDT